MITPSKLRIQESIRPENLTVKKKSSRYDLNYDSIDDDRQFLQFRTITATSDYKFEAEDDGFYSDSIEMDLNPESSIKDAKEYDDFKQEEISLNFDKIDIGILSSNSCTTSALTVLMSNSPLIKENNSNHSFDFTSMHDSNSACIKLEIYFDEFKFDESIKINLFVRDAQILINEIINKVINKFVSKYPLKKLKSYDATNYDLKFIEEDELKEDEICQDDLDIILHRNSKLFDFIMNS